MRRVLIALSAAVAMACSPPASAPAEEAPAADSAGETAEAPAPDYGPYSNAWDSNEFSTFRHTLYAPTPGPHTLTLSAQTNAGGGETVAVYPIGPDGEALTARIMFVIATISGNSETAELDFPSDGSGVEVQVAVENASGQTLAGMYTLTVEP